MIAANTNLKKCIVSFLSWNLSGALLYLALNLLLSNDVYKINSIIIIFTILNLNFIIWMINHRINFQSITQKRICITAAIALSLIIIVYCAFLPLATYSYIANKDNGISILKFNPSYKNLLSLTNNDDCNSKSCNLQVNKLRLHPTCGNFVNIEISTNLNNLTINSVSMQKIKLLNNLMILE